MDSKKIEKYIEDGLELELLDKLNSYVITGFDKRTKNLIKILIIMQEEAKIDWMKPNQALINLIVKILPELISNDSSNNNLNELINLLKESGVKPYERISFLIRQFIIGIQDKDAKLRNANVPFEQLEEFREELIKVNVDFLRIAIRDKLSFSNIITIFYNCVSKLAEERKTILDDGAINIFKSYIQSTPDDYLKAFIRPYYTSGFNNNYPDYYIHVAEPFYSQIFKGDESFTEFLEESKNKISDIELIEDIKNFHQRLLTRPEIEGNRSLILKSELTPNGLGLKSKNHINVRPEFK
jgi:hypothetical protein